MTYDEYYAPGGPYEQAYLASLKRQYKPNKDPSWKVYNDPEHYARTGGGPGTAMVHVPGKGYTYKEAPTGVGKDALGTAADILGDTVTDGVGKGGGLKGFFANAKTNLGNAWGNIKAGKGAMPQYAGLAKGAMGISAGLKALQGMQAYSEAKKNTDDLVNDILASAAGNPNLRYDLSADQLATLRKLQNGTYDTTGDLDLGGVLSNAGDIAMGAGMGFVTGGGIPGAILGGLGGLVDGVSSKTIGNQEQITADLQGLYQALYESEMANKAMKRDAYMQRYQRSLY